jgi:hypothetical protein
MPDVADNGNLVLDLYTSHLMRDDLMATTPVPESDRIKAELTAALRASEAETEKLRRALAAITDGETPAPSRPRRQRAQTNGKASNGGATRRTRSRRTTGKTPAASSATTAASTSSSRQKRAPRGNRKRAKPGANQAAVLAAAGKNPGSTPAELAATSGVSPAVIGGVLRTLTQREAMVREKRSDGKTVYRVAQTSASAASAS